jgi:hypothetical protein
MHTVQVFVSVLGCFIFCKRPAGWCASGAGVARVCAGLWECLGVFSASTPHTALSIACVHSSSSSSSLFPWSAFPPCSKYLFLLLRLLLACLLACLASYSQIQSLTFPPPSRSGSPPPPLRQRMHRWMSDWILCVCVCVIRHVPWS